MPGWEIEAMAPDFLLKAPIRGLRFMKSISTNPKTVRAAAAMVALVFILITGALLGLNVSQAQAQDGSPGNPIVVALSSLCGPGNPSNEECGAAPAEFKNPGKKS